MATSSVSKGCFVFKPDFKRKKVSFPIADYFSEGEGLSEDSKLRFDTCQLLWQQMKSEAEIMHSTNLLLLELQKELNKNLFDNLIEFLGKSHLKFQKKSTDWSCQIKSREIPAAALVLGVNVTDHDLTFKGLTEMLKDTVTPYVVSLQAKECPDVKHLLQKLASQLMGSCIDIESTEEEYVQSSQRKMHYSMAFLSTWYRSVTQKTGAESVNKKMTYFSHWKQSPPVVIILKDIESFSTKVLQDFIIISSQYLHELPIVLVFGIATSPIIIHRLLPQAVSSLCIELLQSLSCKEHLAKLLDKLLLTTRFPFKLNEKALQVLTNIFLYHDFSVQNFIKGLQLAVLEHFYSQPLSILCCDLPEAKRRIHSLSEDQCESIRRLPSFMRYVEEQTPEKQVASLTDERFLKEETLRFLEELHIYHENFFLVLRCFHAFTSSLPKYPLGRQIRELYCACLEKNIWESQEYEPVLQLLRMLAKDELMAILQKCVEVFKPSPGKQLRSIAGKLQEFLAQFQSLEEYKEEENGSGSQQKGLQKTDLYHLQKSLLEMKELRSSNKKQTKFEVQRDRVVDLIDSLVRKYLFPPDTQTLYEVVYFTGAHVLREHLNAAPRIALHTALNNPYHYLKNQALKSEDDSIPNVAPDICIAYKLHLECSRLINLVDWSEAFATVVTAAEETDPNSTASEEIKEIIHARFIRAVSELELLGFIKPTKQKTDHVARLTWGGC
ncbi:origin recognition complex subunit 3 isoform X2 [Petaurus breviceps papuanus]|uniref:origin recognition complex subunit 3 isoform X2 n=1 Tax=Petaurus breviceps papuanus TaxID=3040969 RepID=UPI0036DF5A72